MVVITGYYMKLHDITLYENSRIPSLLYCSKTTKLDPLSVGIVKRQLSSDSGMFCAIAQYKHNRTYVTKLHTYVHTASSLPLADARNL